MGTTNPSHRACLVRAGAAQWRCGTTTILVAGLLFAGRISCAADSKVDFTRDIRPILSDNCFHCHGPDEQRREAGLRLDVESAAMEAGETGRAILPGNSGESELYRRLASTDPDQVMPPPDSQRALTAEQIALVKRWIDEGAVWDGHWAFRRIVRPALPAASRAAAPRNPIDALVAARLQTEGLIPAPEAPREILIRRVTLDLTGLPPTPDEVATFVQDPAPDAYERLVDRLLASPAFGERMAWNWLDAARYADSNGYQGDGERTMWPWRDWVVEAFNRNLPYDQFTVWQLAGDLLADATLEQRLASGFCRNHMINGEGGRIPEENRVDYVMDMTETLGTVWLGLTLNCCRCHDHKYDPLTRRDYYRLFAFFNQTPIDGSGGHPQTPPVVEKPSDDQQRELVRLHEQVATAATRVQDWEQSYFPRGGEQTPDQSEKAAGLPDAIKAILKQPAAHRSREQLVELEKQFTAESAEYGAVVQQLRSGLEQRDALVQSIPRVMVMQDMPTPRETYLLDKGLYDKRGEVVTAAVPASLTAPPAGAPPNRLGLASWLIAPENPLPARVTVNRFWQQFFGLGLVKTPEDFGSQGELPPQPELLDWLAADFLSSGWDVKRLCRLIVTSATYRQSSQVTPALLERDPENRLLARGPRFRLPSWMIRDQALAVSGLLVRRLSGPPANPYQPPGIWEETTFGTKKYSQDHGPQLYRRSLYTFWRRIVAPTAFFDNASRQICSVKQLRTNTPLHALATLNDVTYVEAARNLAQRVILTAGDAPEARIELAYRLALARAPRAAEWPVLLRSLERLQVEFAAAPEEATRLLNLGESPRNEQLRAAEHAAYTAFCLALLNLDEVLSKE